MTGSARLSLTALAFALPALAQGFVDLKFERLAQGYRFTAGPAWSKELGYLIFSDTPSDRLLKWVPGNAIEVYVHRLRKKLEAGGVRIVTVRGLGYSLEKAPA